MSRAHPVWRGLLAAGLALLLVLPAWAADSLRIGVLTFRPLDVARAQWQPLEEHLRRAMPDVDVQVHVLEYDAFNQAMRNQQLDVLITQPVHYVQFAHRYGLLSPVATVINQDFGKPVRAYGGAIVVRSDRADLQTLRDLAHKRIVVSTKASFGGYQMQAYELKVARVEPESITEVGMPQDKSIAAVLAGEADAAFVRTGLIEAMAREGRLDLSRVKTLNAQGFPDYPHATSTRLYPEWPVAVMPRVSEALIVRLNAALLSIPHGGPLARSMGIHGFTMPMDYEPVRTLLREMRLEPFDVEPAVTLRGIWNEYHPLLLVLAAALATLVALALRMLVLHRRVTAITDAMGECLYVLDDHGRATFVNRAMVDLLGYPRAALLGQPIHGLIRAAPSASGDSLPPQRPAPGPGEAYAGEELFVDRNGRSFPVEVRSQPVRDGGRTIRSVTVFHDISERKQQEEHVYNLAFHDALTGLPNRRFLVERLQQLLAQGPARGRSALLLTDLDRFKQINDTLGHEMGDRLLQLVAQRLRRLPGAGETIARLGGDEFGLLVEQLDSDLEAATQRARLIAEDLRARLNEPFELGDKSHHISPSIGIVLFGERQETADQLLKRADIAMYQAKDAGRNTLRFYDATIEAGLSTRMALETDLRRAVRESQFELLYQPQVDAAGRMIGVESLVRWRHPERGLVSPGLFIPLAEETGLILPLGQWVLGEACRQLALWQRNPLTERLVVAVNISAHQIFQPDFVQQVKAALDASGAAPERLQLELTESVLARNIDDIIGKMRALNLLGVTFSLDDFGTGYSSLTYLKRLPLHQLKIDASFVRDLLSDPNDAAITRTIISLGRNLGLEVIAEGVEEQAQQVFLSSQGCPFFQGYLFGRPQPATGIEALQQASAAIAAASTSSAVGGVGD